MVDGMGYNKSLWDALKPGDLILTPFSPAGVMTVDCLPVLGGHVMVEGRYAYPHHGYEAGSLARYHLSDWEGRAPQVLPKSRKWFRVGVDGAPLRCRILSWDRIWATTGDGEHAECTYDHIGKQPIVLLPGQPDPMGAIPGETKKAQAGSINEARADPAVRMAAEALVSLADANMLVEDAAKLLGGLGQGIPTVEEQRAAQGWLHRAWKHLREGGER